MNNASVFIKLLPFNEYNFYVDLYSENPLEAINGLKLFEEELSSELAFYIPETYHKKVIGAGGSTIQSIMRKYNVFIKFSSGQDRNPNGYTHIRSNNVLIRCPAKNSKEILPAKKDLMDTVSDRSQEHGNTFVKLSRSHLRLLLAQPNDFVFDVENKTNTIIMLPSEESFENPENYLEIKGVMGTSDAAARLVKAMLPEDYEFKVAYSHKFDSLVSEGNPDFFEKVIVPFRVALKIEVQVVSKPEHPEGEAPYHQIVLSFAQEHSVGLEDAIQILTAYLREKGLDIIDRDEFHVDPIVQGTAAVVTPHAASKRHGQKERSAFRSRDFGNEFNPTMRPRQIDASRHHNAARPLAEMPHIPPTYERPPHTPSRSYRDADMRQATHPYRKQLGPPKRAFRQSPQSNRFKYQDHDMEYRQPPADYYGHYQENEYPPPAPGYPAHHDYQQTYDYPPRSPPHQLNAGRPYGGSYQQPYREAYHRPTLSAGADYLPPSDGYYEEPHYPDMSVAPPLPQHEVGRPYREDYRGYRHPQSYVSSQAPPPPPPGHAGSPQSSRAYNADYTRGRPRYY